MLRQILCGAVGICACAAVLLARPGVIKTKDGRTLRGEVQENPETLVVNMRGIEVTLNRADVASVDFSPVAEGASVGGQPKARVEEAEEADAPAQRAVESHFLTPAQINVVRQMEIQRSDANLRFRFENDVRRRFASAKGMSLTEFLAQKPIDQAMAILNDNDPKMTPDVKVLEDPASIREYRTRVQRTVMAGCAATNCHGGTTRGGAFVLYPKAEGEAGVYTNFYILQKFSKAAPGVAPSIFGGGGVRRLINRTQPEQSLLLQYGLPPAMTDVRHADVPGYRPIFPSREDARYKHILTWIHSLTPVQPDYGIDYALPTNAPTSRPAKP